MKLHPRLIPPTERGEQSMMRYRPRGVIAVVTPWNNPVAIPLGQIAPALLYGNAVVWKSAPVAAAISDGLMQLIEVAGRLIVWFYNRIVAW
jgi:acyl-CoA reductase-like NAD-dependent aldehyde dehydrogenase